MERHNQPITYRKKRKEHLFKIEMKSEIMIEDVCNFLALHLMKLKIRMYELESLSFRREKI